MRSRIPKVLHRIAGTPLLSHVVRVATTLEPTSIHAVIPASGDSIKAALEGQPLGFAIQDPPAGTADAVAAGCAAIGEQQGVLLVLNGDCPGIRSSTLRRMIAHHADAAASFMTVDLADPTGYGRLLRDAAGDPERIVEEADADERTRSVREVNAGIYLFELSLLKEILVGIKPDNSQGEFYLTDTLAILRERGLQVKCYRHSDPEEVQGVNDRVHLARAELMLRRNLLDALMAAGVTLRDPTSTYVDVDVHVGQDTVLYPGVTLEAGSRIGETCTLYPNVRVTRCNIGNRVTVWDGSILEDSEIGDAAQVGPYARLRPGAVIGAGAKIGNFVEVKKSRIGAGSKASHLSYLGDAEIGEGVNIGAGTITCNYDGTRKHVTIIEDGAFIGSNTALVAPVRVGAGAYVGAGSTITEDVGADELGIARGRQHNKKRWAKTDRVSKNRERG